jgi:hypothetical protein
MAAWLRYNRAGFEDVWPRSRAKRYPSFTRATHRRLKKTSLHFERSETKLRTGEHDMTQILNALHTNLNGGRESLAREASMRKQAGRQNTGIRHVGLRARNPEASAEFYRDVLGMEIVGGSSPDHPLGATAFLSSRPDEELHEIALFAKPVLAHIVFKVCSLTELRSFHARVVVLRAGRHNALLL